VVEAGIQNPTESGLAQHGFSPTNPNEVNTLLFSLLRMFFGPKRNSRKESVANSLNLKLLFHGLLFWINSTVH